MSKNCLSCSNTTKILFQDKCLDSCPEDYFLDDSKRKCVFKTRFEGSINDIEHTILTLDFKPPSSAIYDIETTSLDHKLNKYIYCENNLRYDKGILLL